VDGALFSHNGHKCFPFLLQDCEMCIKLDPTFGKVLVKCITLFFYKNLFYKNVQPEICQNIKSMITTNPIEAERRIFFIAFTFLNPENLNYIMSYMESECMCLSTFRSCYYVNNIYVHCTCTIHLCENYNHYLILSIM